SLTLLREFSEQSGAISMPVVVSARLALARQDREAAVALYRQILGSARPLGRTRGAITFLQALASLALHDDELVMAVQLLGAAKSIEKSNDYRQPRHDPSGYVRTTKALRARLNEDTFARAWHEGEAVTPDEAVAAALAVLDRTPV